MIDKNQALLIELINNALFQTELNIPEDADWQRVYDESVAQTVTSLVAESVPAEFAAVFNETLMQCRAHYMKLLYEQSKLIELINAAGIPAMIIKGTAATKYYPVPFNRIMGDIDVLVPAELYEQAKTLLAQNGYVFENEEAGRQAAYYKNDICIELHYCFSQKNPVLEEAITSCFSNLQMQKISGYSFPILPEAENGLLILAHIQYHILSHGLGLRQLIDWEMFVNAHQENDFWENAFLPLAEKCGLYEFAMTLTSMCKNYLLFPAATSWCEDINQEQQKLIFDNVMNLGNFGYKIYNDNSSNRSAIVYMRLREAIKNKELFKMLQENGLENWEAAKKHPFLKPFAFIYQIFRYLKMGINEAFHKNGLKQIKTANDKIEIHQELNK